MIWAFLNLYFFFYYMNRLLITLLIKSLFYVSYIYSIIILSFLITSHVYLTLSFSLQSLFFFKYLYQYFRKEVWIKVYYNSSLKIRKFRLTETTLQYLYGRRQKENDFYMIKFAIFGFKISKWTQDPIYLSSPTVLDWTEIGFV